MIPSASTAHDVNTYAAYLISTFVESTLLGVLAVQTRNYYTSYMDDPMLTKVWVALVVAVHIAHSAGAASLTYASLVSWDTRL